MWWVNWGLLWALASIPLRASPPSTRPQVIVGSHIISSEHVSTVKDEVLVPLRELAKAVGLKAEVGDKRAKIKGWRGEVLLRASSE